MADQLTAPTVDLPLSLSMAMVQAAPVPVLLLDGALNVVVASRSFSRAFGIDPALVANRSLFDLGNGEWNVPQLHSLLDATSSGAANIDSYEMDLERAGMAPRRLTLNAQKLAYDRVDQTRLLLTIVDVTDARAAEKLKDELVRDKNVLLQEMQHRIANSLQIIASVIMQSARTTSSDETRHHLRDTHHRVMSVATLQQQLTMTPQGEIDLHIYFTKLCESISASMIGDQGRLSLTATSDGSAVPAEMSVSLCLIATELVINALKHAFPDDRAGKIEVDYRSRGKDWTLSVRDDGVGILSRTPAATAGLGTSIVQALSKQLRATVEVADAHPGTRVSVVHDDAPAPAPIETADVATPI
jgi:two-component sensor histidine kinase